MNCPQQIDDITAFMGPLSAEEYELRRRIKVYRNAASYKPTVTGNRDARTFCWIICDTASAWLYSQASPEELRQVASYLRRLLILADQAEEVEALK